MSWLFKGKMQRLVLWTLTDAVPSTVLTAAEVCGEVYSSVKLSLH